MASPIKISEAGSLALHGLVLLASRPHRRITTGQMARELDASEAHLSKVLQRLARAGLVRSTRGPGGGFALAADPAEINLLEAYEAIEGRLSIPKCLFDEPVCSGEGCILGGMMEEVGKQFRSRFESTTLAELSHVFAGAD